VDHTALVLQTPVLLKACYIPFGDKELVTHCVWLELNFAGAQYNGLAPGSPSECLGIGPRFRGAPVGIPADGGAAEH